MRKIALLTAVLVFASPVPFTEPVGEVVSQSAISGTTDTPTDTPTGTAVTPTKKKKTETFKVTAYCPCRECSGEYGRQTSTGRMARAGHTVAVDPTVIRYGAHVKINGVEYVAEDCGGAVKGNTIDIFFDTHEETEDFGVKYLSVEVMR
jgi:3D (Asp-Asp-Asp) domain-containing protein